MTHMESAMQATTSFLTSLDSCRVSYSDSNFLVEGLISSLKSDGLVVLPVDFSGTSLFENNFHLDPSPSFQQGEEQLYAGIGSTGGFDGHLRGLRSETNGYVDSESFDYVDVISVVVCILMAGLASGLTQGLLSLDFMEMNIKSRSGTLEEKAYTSRILPIISNHHLLLVTLMLWNASATEALPIFLNKLVPEYMAVIISVTLVLLFGEIIPASILTGPKQLQISASLTPLVYFVLFIFFPIAYPIAKILDWVIGHDSGMTVYNRQEISTMVRLQHEEGVRRASSDGAVVGGGNRSSSTSGARAAGSSYQYGSNLVHQEEVTIIDGALKYREMLVSEVMTPIDVAYMIPVTEKLSYKTMYDIFKSGYSRIPVYDRDRSDIVGLILVKDLIFVDPEDETPLRNFIDLFGRRPVVVWHDERLGETLGTFIHERAHMAIVRDVHDPPGHAEDPVYTVVGIITLEDIVEEILGTEIEDEFDAHKTQDTYQSAVTHLNDPVARFGVGTGIGRGIGAAAAVAVGGGGGGDDQLSLSPITESEKECETPIRDVELARLRTIRSGSCTGKLAEEEVKSVSIYLFTNVPEIQKLYSDDLAGLQNLVRSSKVITMPRKSVLPPQQQQQEQQGHKVLPHWQPVAEDVLYRRGKMTNSCTLVLDGIVAVLPGADVSAASIDAAAAAATATGTFTGGGDDIRAAAPLVEKGPWSLLAAEALTAPEGYHIPDFSAYINSERVRFLHLSSYHASPTQQDTTDGDAAAGVGAGGVQGDTAGQTAQREVQGHQRSGRGMMRRRQSRSAGGFGTSSTNTSTRSFSGDVAMQMQTNSQTASTGAGAAEKSESTAGAKGPIDGKFESASAVRSTAVSAEDVTRDVSKDRDMDRDKRLAHRTSAGAAELLRRVSSGRGTLGSSSSTHSSSRGGGGGGFGVLPINALQNADFTPRAQVVRRSFSARLGAQNAAGSDTTTDTSTVAELLSPIGQGHSSERGLLDDTETMPLLSTAPNFTHSSTSSSQPSAAGVRDNSDSSDSREDSTLVAPLLGDR